MIQEAVIKAQHDFKIAMRMSVRFICWLKMCDELHGLAQEMHSASMHSWLSNTLCVCSWWERVT